MKKIISVIIAIAGVASVGLAQTASPTRTTPATGASPTSTPTPASGATARTDMYHVHFAKAALGKAAELADVVKKPDPSAPMPGHLLVLRHQDGDAWDYCAIEHLGTKATIEANRPAPPASEMGLGDWHTDTLCSGPSWAEFAKQMGIDDASKGTGAAYIVSMYRTEPGQREALDKFVNEPPDRTTDTFSGSVVLQHMEGAAWTFVRIQRYNSWADFAKEQTSSVAQMSKSDAGWFRLRSLVSFHTDTLCDRIAP